MSIISRVRINSLKLVVLIVGAAMVTLGLVSCGTSGSTNDQGTSFLNLGYFANATGTEGESGAIVPLFADTDIFISGSDGGLVLTFIGLENRLINQFIRVDSIDCSYEIQGADPLLVLPSDSFPIGTVIEAGTEGAGSQSFSQFILVSPDVMAFINNNTNLLPQLPFRMTVRCSATGVSQAGDRFTTNDAFYTIQFVDQAECCTGAPGFQVGVGTGGSFTGAAASSAATTDTTGATTSGSTISGTSSAGSSLGSTGTGTSSLSNDGGVASDDFTL